MRRILVLAVVSLLVIALVAGVGWAQSTPTARVLIGFKGSPDPAVVKATGGEVKHVYSIIPAVCAVVPTPALEVLKRHPAVDYVEPDGQCHILQQILPWGVNDIGAPYVCWQGNQGYQARLAIIDTGVDLDHPDLVVLGGYDFVNGDSFPDDDHGHGTSVATIAAARDNDIGVVGVAPQAYVYAVKVLNAYGAGSWSTVIQGIDWCWLNGMHVLSLALGGTSGSAALEGACQNAWNSGMVLVGAAGERGNPDGTGDNVVYPARYSSVIAVAAVDFYHARPSWSSTGPAVELSAPGVNIYTTCPGGYTTMSGTSLACPHVAGVACLVRAGDWGLTNQQIRDAMNNTAKDLGEPGRDPKYGYGLVWAPAAATY